MEVADPFRRVATKTAELVGEWWAFLLALVVVLGWAATGPLFGFADTWQLVINTGTTIVTFLMVFLIQASQNRDGRAIQLKLDELIRASKGARDAFVDIEDASDADLRRMAKEFRALHEKAQSTLDRRGVSDRRSTNGAGRAARS
jgi:low affinity Fe/Cu permease